MNRPLAALLVAAAFYPSLTPTVSAGEWPATAPVGGFAHQAQQDTARWSAPFWPRVDHSPAITRTLSTNPLRHPPAAPQQSYEYQWQQQPAPPAPVLQDMNMTSAVRERVIRSIRLKGRLGKNRILEISTPVSLRPYQTNAKTTGIPAVRFDKFALGSDQLFITGQQHAVRDMQNPIRGNCIRHHNVDRAFALVNQTRSGRLALCLNNLAVDRKDFRFAI